MLNNICLKINPRWQPVVILFDGSLNFKKNNNNNLNGVSREAIIYVMWILYIIK